MFHIRNPDSIPVLYFKFVILKNDSLLGSSYSSVLEHSEDLMIARSRVKIQPGDSFFKMYLVLSNFLSRKELSAQQQSSGYQEYQLKGSSLGECCPESELITT